MPLTIDRAAFFIRLISGQVEIREAEAQAYVAAAVLRSPLASINCPYCSAPHLDEHRFAVHPHQSHLCHTCKRQFLNRDRSVGNPIMVAKRELDDAQVSRPTVPGGGPLRIDQSADYCSGGLLIWGSNPAILWTAQRDEEEGIHVHAHMPGEESLTIDNTYASVEIDGIMLNASMVRLLMVQRSLAHIRGSVTYVRCSRCGAPHYDEETPFAVEPHQNHPCTQCQHVEFTSGPIISNPLVQVLTDLYSGAGKHGLAQNPLAV
jgi:transposase-like protein